MRRKALARAFHRLAHPTARRCAVKQKQRACVEFLSISGWGFFSSVVRTAYAVVVLNMYVQMRMPSHVRQDCQHSEPTC